MEENSDFLSIKIIKTFHLFEGMREREEDEKIFDKVCGQCLPALIDFLDKNLLLDQKRSLLENLQKIKLDDKRAMYQLFQNFQQHVQILSSENQAKLRDYLGQFIDDLLTSIIKKSEYGRN